MKYIIITGFILGTLLLKACEFNLPYNTGFDANFNENSNGLTMAHVSNKVNSIFLEGSIKIVSGDVEITLTDPSGTTVYSRILSAPENIYLSERFGAVNGLWKLNYKSIQGTGKINLHMGY